MFLFRTNDAAGSSFYFRTNDPDADVVVAGGTGATATTSAAAGGAIGYAYVTMAEPFYFGQGSIFHASNFQGTPVAGDVARYPTDKGFRILPNGEALADDYGTWECFYNPQGAGEVPFTVILDDSTQVFADAATATAQAADASLYGGVNVDGAGAQANATPSGGSVNVGTTASGAGAQANAQAPAASVGAGASPTAAGAQADAIASTGVAEILEPAEGAGAQATATAAQATATAGVTATGAGATATAAGATAVARGDLAIGDIPVKVLFKVGPRNQLRAA